MDFEEFSARIEELWKEYKGDTNQDFLLTVLNHNDDDTVGDVAMIGYGCAACVVMVLSAMALSGQIKHNAGEQVH